MRNYCILLDIFDADEFQSCEFDVSATVERGHPGDRIDPPCPPSVVDVELVRIYCVGKYQFPQNHDYDSQNKKIPKNVLDEYLYWRSKIENEIANQYDSVVDQVLDIENQFYN